MHPSGIGGIACSYMFLCGIKHRDSAMSKLKWNLIESVSTGVKSGFCALKRTETHTHTNMQLAVPGAIRVELLNSPSVIVLYYIVQVAHCRLRLVLPSWRSSKLLGAGPKRLKIREAHMKSDAVWQWIARLTLYMFVNLWTELFGGPGCACVVR